MLARVALSLIAMLGGACAPAVSPQVAGQPVAASAPTPVAAPTPGASSAPAVPRVLLPVDEASRDPSFVAFRESLMDVVARKDRAALLAVIDPTGIRSSFGGDGTLAEFENLWSLDRPDSKLWPELLTVLSMGGAFESDDAFWAPYVFSSFPESVDAFEWLAITGQKAPLHSEPRDESPILARLDYTLVRSPDAPEPGDWTRVTLDDVGTGFVRSDLVRSPVDYRAVFTKRDGRWVMTAFVAGD